MEVCIDLSLYTESLMLKPKGPIHPQHMRTADRRSEAQRTYPNPLLAQSTMYGTSRPRC